jgi:hypothetical protein
LHILSTTSCLSILDPVAIETAELDQAGDDLPQNCKRYVVDLIVILGVEMPHAEVGDLDEHAEPVTVLCEPLQSENQQGQQDLLLMHVETVQEER